MDTPERATNASPEETLPDTSPPLLRSPWFWGFVLGVVFLTAIRPVMRRIPEPPAEGALIPAFVTDKASSGATVRREDDILWDPSTKGIQAYTLWTPGCGDPCSRALDVLRRAEGHLARRGVEILPITLIADLPDASPIPPELFAQTAGASSWELLQVPGESSVFANLDAQAGATSNRDPSSIAAEGYVWIVAPTGRVSGRYSTHADDAVDELSARLATLWGAE